MKVTQSGWSFILRFLSFFQKLTPIGNKCKGCDRAIARQRGSRFDDPDRLSKAH